MDTCTMFLHDPEPLPTGLVALIPDFADHHTAERVLESVRPLGDGTSHLAEPEIVTPGPDERWRIRLGSCKIACAFTPHAEMSLRMFGDGLSDEEVERAKDAMVAIRVDGPVPLPVLQGYHHRLRLLHAAAPDALAVFDDGQGLWRGPTWLETTAQCSVPPGPRSLYTTHVVAQDPDDPDGRAWIHTHGLNRCGSIDLEALDVPAMQVGVLQEVMDATAAAFLEDGVSPAGEIIDVVHGNAVTWLPWERALAETPPRGPGRREDRDEIHSSASGVLLLSARHGRRGGKPLFEPLAAQISGNSRGLMVRLPKAESLRRAAMATERFPLFRDAFRRFGDQPGFQFLVDLGYGPDEDRDAGIDAELPARPVEHMWFEVHAVDGLRVEATLLDDPHTVRRMKRGDRGWHAVDELGTWAIVSPLGLFEPERADLMQLRLGLRRRRSGRNRRHPPPAAE